MGSSLDGSVGILTYQSMSAILHLRKSTTSGSLGAEHFQQLLDLSGEFCISSSCISSPSSVRFLADHAKGQFRLLILGAPCWMEAPLLPTVLNMLADVSLHCPIVQHLIMDVLIGQVLKSL